MTPCVYKKRFLLILFIYTYFSNIT